MKVDKSAAQRVTEEELAALLGPRAGGLAGSESGPAHAQRALVAVDGWFKHRNLFFVVMLAAYSIKLIFYPAGALGQFDDQMLSADYLLRYAYLRLAFITLLATAYTLSYLKDWHFKELSWVFFGTGLMALLADLVHAYPYLGDIQGPGLAALIALRVTAVYFLLLHALNAHRAPFMPRRPWS